MSDLRLWQDPEPLGNEDAIHVLADTIAGLNVASKHRSDYSREDIVGGHGSANIPRIQASVDLAWQIHHGTAAAEREIATAWGRCMERGWWTHEPGSSFTYGLWNSETEMVSSALLRWRGHDAESDRVWQSVRMFAFLASLSAGWEQQGQRWRGYPVTLTGARSWITDRDGGGDYDRNDDGVPDEPYMLDEVPTTMVLGYLLGLHGYPTEAFGEVMEALRQVGAPNPVLDRSDRDLCLAIIKANRPDRDLLARVVSEINASGMPLPRVPFVAIRTTEATASLSLKSINPGSTSYCYGRVWYAQGRPSKAWIERLPWQTHPRYCPLAVDPSVRKAGVSGKAEYELLLSGGLRMRAQRTSEDRTEQGTIPPNCYYDELAGGWLKPSSYAAGWRHVDVPGEVTAIVEVGPQGARLIEPEGEVEPPPASEPLAAPIHLWPAHESEQWGDVEIAWQGVEGATGYEVVAQGVKTDLDADQTNMVLEAYEEGPVWWKVRAFNDFEEGPWHEPWMFEAVEVPTAHPKPPGDPPSSSKRDWIKIGLYLLAIAGIIYLATRNGCG